MERPLRIIWPMALALGCLFELGSGSFANEPISAKPAPLSADETKLLAELRELDIYHDLEKGLLVGEGALNAQGHFKTARLPTPESRPWQICRNCRFFRSPITTSQTPACPRSSKRPNSGRYSCAVINFPRKRSPSSRLPGRKCISSSKWFYASNS